MGDGCRCVCHRNPKLRDAHVCACRTEPTVRPGGAGDWYEEAMARYRAQFEAGNRVARAVLEHARGNCSTCGLMLNVTKACPDGHR